MPVISLLVFRIFPITGKIEQAGGKAGFVKPLGDKLVLDYGNTGITVFRLEFHSILSCRRV